MIKKSNITQVIEIIYEIRVTINEKNKEKCIELFSKYNDKLEVMIEEDKTLIKAVSELKTDIIEVFLMSEKKSNVKSKIKPIEEWKFE